LISPSLFIHIEVPIKIHYGINTYKRLPMLI
jgi:hypothetical protein